MTVYFEILLLALGLAMDATAVSAARSLRVPAVRLGHAVLVAVYFGGFQAGMTVLGWLLGNSVGSLLGGWDRWMAFVLLAGIGVHMLVEARSTGDEDRSEGEPFAHTAMALLAIATSIDALAAGVTLPLLHVPVGLAVGAIGVAAAILSVGGLLAGHRLGAHFGQRIEVVGGLVLIGLGLKAVSV